MTLSKIVKQEDYPIVTAARYLGFKSTGQRMRHRFKHAIRVLIRNGDPTRVGCRRGHDQRTTESYRQRSRSGHRVHNTARARFLLPGRRE